LFCVLWGYCFNQDTNIWQLFFAAKSFLKYLYHMRDLIKKILKEFDSDNVVSFRIIGKADEFLNEQLSQEDKISYRQLFVKKLNL